MKSEMSNDEQEKNAPRVLSFCPTRWTVRGKTLDSILKNYSSLQNLWEWALENCTDTDMKARIRGVDKHMEEFDFYFGVALGELLLRHSDNLSATLQKEEISAAGAQNIVQMTLTALMSFRSDDSFLLFWDKVLMLSRQVGVNEPSLPRQKKAPSRFESSSDSHYFPTNVKEHFKKIYFEAIDTLTACLKDRFDQSDFNMYAKLEQVLLKSAKSECCEEEIEECCTFYGSDLDDNTLKTQLQIFSGICKTNQLDTGCLLSDIINLFKTLTKPQISLISQVARLLKLILVMPATNAVSERSFSAMRRLKTYLRTNMSMARLNNLMVLHVHKPRTDSLDVIEIANSFADTEHRQSIFGKFSQRDIIKPAEKKPKGTQTDPCSKEEN